MTHNQLASNLTISCAACRAQLPEYVRRELAGADVMALFPDATLHMAGCPSCEAAYFELFHSEGTQRSLAELRQLGDRSAVASTLDAILSPALPASPDWREAALAHGSAWFDRVTGRMRQAHLWLGDLLQPPALAPVLAGLQGEADAPMDGASLRVDVADGVELVLRLFSDLPAQPELVDLEIAVSLPSRFGDYSGVQVVLQSPEESRTAVTDTLGKVVFTGIARSSIAHVQVLIQAPE